MPQPEYPILPRESTLTNLPAEYPTDTETCHEISVLTFWDIHRPNRQSNGPKELDAAQSVFGPADALILAPFLFPGGKFTSNDVHYVAEGNNLVPTGATQFTKDATFGYKSSDLRDYIAGKVPQFKAEQVCSVTIEEIRTGGPETICEKLLAAPVGNVVIVNAAAESDMHVLSNRAVDISSTAPARPSSRLDLSDLKRPSPGLSFIAHHPAIQVGWLLPGPQLKVLMDRRGATDQLAVIEMNVDNLLSSAETVARTGSRIAQEMESHLRDGMDTLVMTSRKLVIGDDEFSSLKIGGGSTASEAATQGLNIKRATIVGQAAPGIPLWQCDRWTSHHRDVHFVVFPANVGGDTLQVGGRVELVFDCSSFVSSNVS
ncbi:hypothetical protein N7457_009869 [Penicillium paradoxum]|uniref:uncharacterized protein n=1 Tax=Penicillium paradoxum TaxID=176176 RepID=UPI002547A61A|nr:uncharacterized protein N7457_009869 [Penicillium paradoxum]KAJ5774973.1 hypothetical protein N7457_009869 [Penicillium paradoxum]